jgi:hypothetical protein
LAANSIIQLSTVREYLKKASGDTTQDSALQGYIDLASGAIERYIQGPVVVQNYADEIYDGSGCAELFIDKRPVTALLTPAASDLLHRDDPTGAWQTLEADVNMILIDKKAPHKITLFQGVFPKGRQNIKLSHKAGYVSVPDDIKRVCLEMVAEIYAESNMGRGRLGQSSIGSTAGGVNSSDDFYQLSERHMAVLRRYRKISV